MKCMVSFWHLDENEMFLIMCTGIGEL
jgi:hypothetical protein